MQQTLCSLLTKPFFPLLLVFLAHVSSSDGGKGEWDILFLCCLFWFTVLNTTRRSTGREGKRSKVTVFNSEGIRRQQPQQQEAAVGLLLLAPFTGVSSGGGGGSIWVMGRRGGVIHLIGNLRTSCTWKQTHKRQHTVAVQSRHKRPDRATFPEDMWNGVKAQARAR